MEPAAQWIVLAHVLRPQGRRGEVLAELWTDFPQRFREHPRVWLAPAGFADQAWTEAVASSQLQQVEVVSHWLPVGRNAERIVLHFSGVDSIQKAEQLAGKDVVVPLAERMPLTDGAAYISDIVGCTVYDRGQVLGVVEAVEFPTTPDGSRRIEEAPPLLAIKPAVGDVILVPFAGALLQELDVAAKSIRMALPEGLADINRTASEEKG